MNIYAEYACKARGRNNGFFCLIIDIIHRFTYVRKGRILFSYSGNALVCLATKSGGSCREKIQNYVPKLHVEREIQAGKRGCVQISVAGERAWREGVALE